MENITFTSTDSSYYDGVTTRSYNERSLTPEEAASELERLSREKTLLYETLDRIRHSAMHNDHYQEKSKYPPLDNRTLIQIVNYAVMYVFHQGGPGRSDEMTEEYRQCLADKGFNMDKFFYTVERPPRGTSCACGHIVDEHNFPNECATNELGPDDDCSCLRFKERNESDS